MLAKMLCFHAAHKSKRMFLQEASWTFTYISQFFRYHLSTPLLLFTWQHNDSDSVCDTTASRPHVDSPPPTHPGCPRQQRRQGVSQGSLCFQPRGPKRPQLVSAFWQTQKQIHWNDAPLIRFPSFPLTQNLVLFNARSGSRYLQKLFTFQKIQTIPWLKCHPHWTTHTDTTKTVVSDNTGFWYLPVFFLVYFVFLDHDQINQPCSSSKRRWFISDLWTASFPKPGIYFLFGISLEITFSSASATSL